MDRRRRAIVVGVACAAAVAVAGCSSSDPATVASEVPATTGPEESTDDTPPSTRGPDSTGPDTTDGAGPDDSAPPTTAPDDEPTAIDIDAVLAQDPLVLFSAYPPKPDHVDYPLPPGQRDFFELWEPDAPWQTALEHVDVYRLHAFQMRHFLDDEQLVTLIEFLREHEIPLMLETEPLQPVDPDECAHTESFEGPWDLEMAARLKALGGHVDVIAIEEPYHFAHLLDTPDACRYTVERIVDEVMIHVDALRDLFGDIPVGTIEPIWASPATEPRDMEIWLDTFEAIAGEPFAFLHVDPNWYRDDWAEVAVGIEAVADERGVPFGVLYNGGTETDGLAWMNLMMANAAELEIEHGATPQHVSFQSWVDWPDHALPETDLTALTSGVVRYAGDRVELTSEETPEGLVVAARRLDGSPLGGIVLDAGREGGDTGAATQTIRGTVPDDVTEAVILIRANAEDATPGTAAAIIHEVSLTLAGDEANRVPNGDFAGGLSGWGVYGGHPAGARSVAADPGPGLELTAEPGQDVFIDGTVFAVEGGADYELSVAYEVTGGSPDSVVVSVEFEARARGNVFLHPLPTELGEFVTGADGTALIPSDLLGGAPTTIEVTTPGALEHWPAALTVRIG